MTQDEARAYIAGAQKRGIVPGLDNMRAVCAALGHPERKYKIIHIAGTNGKGSVGAFIEQILIHAGLRTGRFSSPAVEDFHECITVNGIFIGADDYGKCIGAVKAAAEAAGASPTAFEIETAAAYEYFARCGCEIAVVEAGMGGRLDATNVIDSCTVSVFTHISADHTAFLGSTLSEIAFEKSGIIKPGCRAVTYAQESNVTSVLARECSRAGAELITAPKAEISASDIHKTIFSADGLENLKIHLAGLHQAHNAALAVCVCHTLIHMGLPVTDNDIRRGLCAAYLPGRFEAVCSNPLIILDGAHNPDAAARLAENLEFYLGNMRTAFIFGMFRDKDCTRTAQLTAPLARKIYCITPPGSRGLASSELAAVTEDFNKNVVASELPDALTDALAEHFDAVVCFGTLSTIKEIKDILRGNNIIGTI